MRLTITAPALTLFVLILVLVPSIQARTMAAGSPQASGAGGNPHTTGSVSVSLDELVGNVDGTVRDANTLLPVAGADIYLFAQPLQKSGSGRLVHTDRGDIILPDLAGASMHGIANDAGEFLINSVPVSFPSQAYTIIITARDYGFFIADGALVLPGAVMTLNVDAAIARDSSVLYGSGDSAAPLLYRHEIAAGSPVPRLSPAAPSAGDDRVTFSIFATREGLVGHTTANGHVIVPNDHFVALPSRRALNANDWTRDYVVRLTYSARTVDAPVWDVGPWNTTDDFWNPSSIRERWGDLAQGMPEAQAAFQNGYNGGKDQYGRKVTVPTAIDLADGTFWNDLGMVDNNWISVKYLWKPNVLVGDSVYAAADLAVRATPAGSQVATEPCGEIGSIIGGPAGASMNNAFMVWWQMRWEDGMQGWSPENQIAKLVLPLAPGQTPGQNQPMLATNDHRYWLPFVARHPTRIACPQANSRF